MLFRLFNYSSPSRLPLSEPISLCASFFFRMRALFIRCMSFNYASYFSCSSYFFLSSFFSFWLLDMISPGGNLFLIMMFLFFVAEREDAYVGDSPGIFCITLTYFFGLNGYFSNSPVTTLSMVSRIIAVYLMGSTSLSSTFDSCNS